MKNTQEIRLILEKLDKQSADTLEDHDLDFKEWNIRSKKDAVHLVVEMAICMANGGGGTVVFGVKDKVLGCKKAITGIPHEIDLNRLKKAVYDCRFPFYLNDKFLIIFNWKRIENLRYSKRYSFMQYFISIRLKYIYHSFNLRIFILVQCNLVKKNPFRDKIM